MVLFVFAFDNVSRAATRTWAGTADVNWSNGANWGGTAPVAGDNVIIPASPTRQPTVDATSTCKILTINGATTLTLSATLTVTTGLTINNQIILTLAGANTLNIAGSVLFTYNTSISIPSTVTVNFTSATIDMTAGNSGNKISNNGKLNFTSTTVNFGFQASITNSSTGTVTASASTFNLYLSSSNANESTINNSGIFTVNGASTILVGDFKTQIINSGTFYAGTSNSACTINLYGQPADSNTGSSIYNTGTFYLGSTSAINFKTGIVRTTINNTSPGVFTIQSDQYGSGSIGQLYTVIPVQSIIGTYNVERFLTGGNVNLRSYRLLSSPVNISSSTTGGGNIDLSYVNTTVGTNYGALTAGPGGTGSGFTVPNNNPTLYLYNESLASNNSSFTSGKNIGIVAMGAGTVSTLTGTVVAPGKTIPVGNGFMFYFIGDNQSLITLPSRVPENTTLTAIGTINQTNILVKLWNTGTAALYATNNLVGNPYPSTIDLTKVYSDNSAALGNIFYELYNVNPGQNYISINGANGMTMFGPNSTYGSKYIASGQGFFCTAVAGNTITFKESQKVTQQLSTSSTPYLLMSTPSQRVVQTNNTIILPDAANSSASFSAQADNTLTGLHLVMMQDSTVFDGCGIYFTNDGADKYDRNDARDLDAISPKVYLSSYTTDGVRTGINALGSYIKGKKVKLYVKAVTNGMYKLNLTDIQNIDLTNYNLYLKDNYAKDSLDLSHNSSYSFRIQNSDTTTFGANRFELVITPKPLPPYALTSFTAKKVNEGVLLTWKTANEGNYTGFILQKQNSNQFIALNNLQSNGAGTYTYIDHNPTTGTNAYRLMQNGLEADISYSETVNALYNSNPLNIYPNPARDNINVYINVPTIGDASSYQMSIYDSSGTLILTKQINKAYTQNVATLRIGTYIVQVTDNNGKLIGNNKFLKTQ
jgi:hypothetical protein